MIAAFLLAATFRLPLQRSDAVIGMAAKDHVFGAACSERADEPFPMGGLARLPIALEVLHRIDEGKLQAKDALLERMVKSGDLAATDRLLRLVGAEAVNRRMAALGAPDVRVDRGTATPAAMEALLTSIAKGGGGLSPASYEKLMLWMETSPGASRIRAGLPPDVRSFAHMEGTTPGATADAAIFGLSIVVIMTKSAKSPQRDVERDVAAVTRVVNDWLDPPIVFRALATPPPRQSSDATFGVWIRNLEWGPGWCEREEEVFPMGALVRLPIALEVLHRADANQDELLERMLRLGDAAATDRLLRWAGAEAINRRMAALGAAEIRVDAGTATPEAMERLLVAVARRDDGLSDASHDKLVRWMEASAGTSRLQAALPSGVKLAHLEGAASGATSDAVIIDGRRVIVMFTKNAKSSPQDVERDIVVMTRYLWDVSAPSPGSRK